MAILAPGKFIVPVLRQLVANGPTLTSEKMHDPIAKQFGLTKDGLCVEVVSAGESNFVSSP
jgi:hypothetical protein